MKVACFSYTNTRVTTLTLANVNDQGMNRGHGDDADSDGAQRDKSGLVSMIRATTTPTTSGRICILICAIVAVIIRIVVRTISL